MRHCASTTKNNAAVVCADQPPRSGLVQLCLGWSYKPRVNRLSKSSVVFSARRLEVDEYITLRHP